MTQFYVSYHFDTRESVAFTKYKPLDRDLMVSLDDIVGYGNRIRFDSDRYDQFFMELKKKFGCKQVFVVVDNPKYRKHHVVFRFKTVDDLIIHKLTHGVIDRRFINEFTSQ